MTLQQHHDRLGQIRRDHWRAYETSSEHEARADEISFDEIMRAGELSEATASRWDRLAAAEYAEMAS